MLKRLAFALAALLLWSVPHPTLAGQRVDVPIGQLRLSNGDLRYYVPVSVGGREPFNAMLDTGSFGLRVLQAAVKPDQYKESGGRARYGFASGSHFSGPLAEATVSVGGLSTQRPVAIQVVEKVECGERRPHCPAGRVSAKEFRMGGAGLSGEGFNAILGISMRRSLVGPDAENPLTAMGDDSWIVVLPRPDSNEPGHLVINPTPEEREGFTNIQLQPQPGGQSTEAAVGWRDGMLSGCIVDDTSSKRLCGKTLIDTGAPGFYVDSMESYGRDQWAGGTRATFEIEGGNRPIKFSFVTGPTQATRVKVHPARNPNVVRISAGTQPYFAYTVLYDAKGGSIGFKQRDPQ